MTSLLVFIAWLLSLGEGNRSTALCLVLFFALLSSCGTGVA